MFVCYNIEHFKKVKLFPRLDKKSRNTTNKGLQRNGPYKSAKTVDQIIGVDSKFLISLSPLFFKVVNT